MAMSGVALDSECKLVYDEVQSKKKHRYVTFKIVEDKAIKVDKVKNIEIMSHFTNIFYLNFYFFRLAHEKVPMTNF